jgi:receptor protein-tyrosine kinase
LRQENIQQVLQEARTALENQLANLPAESRGSEGPRLQELLGNLAIVQQTQRGGYELWQPAQAAPNPISPRPTRDLAAGLAVGLIVGICLALVVDRFDNRLKEPEDFEREYDLPVLAKVPRLGGRGAGRRHQDDGVVGFQRYGAQLLEPYRTLRSSLQFLQAQRGFKTILITSGYPGEGKSAAACNLALALTLSGFRVVLVDADLRNPRIHDYLNLENREGLSNLLAGTAELTATMQRVQVDDYLPRSNGGRPSEGGILPGKLLCITSGTLPPNPAELLGSAQMYSLLSELQNRGDYVILDSPPLLPVADAVALASHLDAVILVGRAGRSSTDEAREVRTILGRVEARPLGVIMIGPPTTARYYGYEQTSELPT